MNHEKFPVSSFNGDHFQRNPVSIVSQKDKSFVVVVGAMTWWWLRENQSAAIDDVFSSVVGDVVFAGRPGESHRPYFVRQ